MARVKSLPRGRWEVPHDEGDRGRLGFLMLEGLLARDVILAGTTCTELLGEGDVLQPLGSRAAKTASSATTCAGTCSRP